uniref:Uncharacterized protein n=1 Tax=Anguilla anguilla TaxID=7936 RepID=A0A0E9UDN9_ANGAN
MCSCFVNAIYSHGNISYSELVFSSF